MMQNQLPPPYNPEPLYPLNENFQNFSFEPQGAQYNQNHPPVPEHSVPLQLSLLESWQLAVSVTSQKLTPIVLRIRNVIGKLLTRYTSFTTTYGPVIGFSLACAGCKFSPSRELNPLFTITGGVVMGRVIGPYLLPVALSYFVIRRKM